MKIQNNIQSVYCSYYYWFHLPIRDNPGIVAVGIGSTRTVIQMASWKSIPLEITYQVFGWIACSCWMVGFYPQVILNFRRKRYFPSSKTQNQKIKLSLILFPMFFLMKINLFFSFFFLGVGIDGGGITEYIRSVVGLNFDFVVLNLIKHSFYLIYNATLYFSSDVQKQYFDKYGYTEMIPVAFNDIAFSTHSVLMQAFALYQIAIYERGAQTVSRITIIIVTVVLLTAGACFFISLPTRSWLWLISIYNSIQIILTLIKYIPQAFMNFARKSTNGFSISTVLFDFSGGVANIARMAVQSIDQDSWVNFYGNMGKTMISLICIFFDLVFMCQRFLLYPAERVVIPPKRVKESKEPLITKSSDHPQIETV